MASATSSPTITKATAAARAESLARWQTMARGLAAGGPMPPAEELLPVAFALGLTAPVEALAADAAAINRVATLEQRVAGREAWRREQLEEHGGSYRALCARVDAARHELERLTKCRNSLRWDARLATLGRERDEAMAAADRVFPPTVKRPRALAAKPVVSATAKPKPRKAAAMGIV